MTELSDSKSEEKLAEELQGEVLYVVTKRTSRSGFLCCSSAASSKTSWEGRTLYLRSPTHKSYAQWATAPVTSKDKKQQQLPSVTLCLMLSDATFREYFAVAVYCPATVPVTDDSDAAYVKNLVPMLVLTTEGTLLKLATTSEEQRTQYVHWLKAHLLTSAFEGVPRSCIHTQSQSPVACALADKCTNDSVSAQMRTLIRKLTKARVLTSDEDTQRLATMPVATQQLLFRVMAADSSSLEGMETDTTSKSKSCRKPKALCSDLIKTRIEYNCADSKLSSRLVSGESSIAVYGDWDDYENGTDLRFQGNLKSDDSGVQVAVFSTHIRLAIGSHCFRFKVSDTTAATVSPPTTGWLLSGVYRQSVDACVEVNCINVPMTAACIVESTLPTTTEPMHSETTADVSHVVSPKKGVVTRRKSRSALPGKIRKEEEKESEAAFGFFLDSSGFSEERKTELRLLDSATRTQMATRFFEEQRSATAEAKHSYESSGKSAKQWFAEIQELAAKCGATADRSEALSTLRSIGTLLTQLIPDIRASAIEFVAELCELDALDSINFMSQFALQFIGSKQLVASTSMLESKAATAALSCHMDVLRSVLATAEDIGFEILCESPASVSRAVSLIGASDLQYAVKCKALAVLRLLALWELDTFEQVLGALQEFAVANLPPEDVLCPVDTAVDTVGSESQAASDCESEDGGLWAVFLVWQLQKCAASQWKFKWQCLALLNAVAHSAFLDFDDRLFVVEQLRLAGVAAAVAVIERQYVDATADSLPSKVVSEARRCLGATLLSQFQSVTSEAAASSRLRDCVHWDTATLKKFFTSAWQCPADGSAEELKLFLAFCDKHSLAASDLRHVNEFVLRKMVPLATDTSVAKVMSLIKVLGHFS